MTERRRTYPLRLRAAEYAALASQAAAAEQTKSGYILGLIATQRETDRQLRVSQALAREALTLARQAIALLKAEREWRVNIPEQIDTSTLTLEQMRSELTQ